MDDFKSYPISLYEIYKARKIVSQHLNPSSLVHYESLSKLLGFEVYVKHENQNLTGSFKVRGGLNIMAHIKQAEIKGVVTFSTGNHGLSVATSAKLFGIPAIVVVPKGSNPVKINLIKEAGAEVVEAGENFDESALVVSEISQSKGYYYVHPANEPHIVNGVGTEFLEVMDQLPDVDAIILPLGGGSEVASAVTVLKTINPDIDIYAVQAEQSSAACCSWKQGEILERSNTTFAGGFATGTAYQATFDIYKDSLSDFILLSENEILQGIALAAHHTRNLVEGAGSSTIMAAWKLREKLAGKKVLLQFSGSNASPEELKNAYELSAFQDGKIR
ncbi:threonine ammonia-lyase [Vibrio sp. RC27]